MKSFRAIAIGLCSMMVLLSLVACSSGFPFDILSKSADEKTIQQQEDVRVQVNQAVEGYESADGIVDPGNVDAYIDAAYHALKDSRSEAIDDIGRNDDCAWVEFTDGSVMVCLPMVDGTSSMSLDKPCSIRTYEPTDRTFSGIDEYLNMYDEAAGQMASLSPNWNYDTNYENYSVTLDSLKELGSWPGSKLILWHGHGGYTSELGPFLQVGETYDGRRRIEDASYNEEFTSKNLVMLMDDGVGITSGFVDDHISNLDGALVYLGSCHSGQTDQLANAFIRSGAHTVLGFSDTVRTLYECSIAQSFTEALCSQGSEGFMNARQACDRAQQECGASDADRFGGDGARPVLFGRPDEFFFEAPKPVEKAPAHPEYGAYYEKVKEYQARYGDHGVRVFNDEWSEFDGTTGLALVNLVDFDHDGIEELVLGYGDESLMDSYETHSNFSAYKLEVWGYDASGIKLLYQGGPQQGDIDIVAFELDVSSDASVPSIIREAFHVAGGDTFEYYALKNGSFERVDSLHVEYEEDIHFFVNGSEVSEAAYDAVNEKYSASPYQIKYYILGDLSYDVGDQIDYQAELFAKTDEVIAKLAESSGEPTGDLPSGGAEPKPSGGGSEGGGSQGEDPNGGEGSSGGSAPSGAGSSQGPGSGKGGFTFDPASYAAGASSNGYILPDAEARVYTAADLEGMTDYDLYFARNELFARHGGGFGRKDLQAYFGSKSWYAKTREAGTYGREILNENELETAETILSIETSHHSAYIVGSDGYVLADSSRRVYPDSELRKMSDYSLYIARNEIPARHGYIFSDSELEGYFKSKDWYRGTLTGDEFRSIAGILNEKEEANVAAMLAIEEERNSPYAPQR